MSEDFTSASADADSPTQDMPPQLVEEKSPEEVAELIATIEKTIDDIIDRQRNGNGLKQELGAIQN
jgi:hypothetical protein